MFVSFAVATVLLTGTACATSATAAATVGAQQISEQAIFERTSSLADQAEQAGQPAPTELERAAVNRAQTTAAIRSRLWEAAAADNGVVITDSQVNAALARQPGVSSGAVTQQGAFEQVVRDLLRMQGVLAAAGTQGLPVTDVTVIIDGARVDSRDEAVALRTALLGDPATADAQLAAAAAPIGRQPLDLLSNPTDAQTGVFAAQPGEVVLYPQGGQYFVVRVLERREAPGVLTARQVQQAQTIGDQFDLAALLLQPYAEQEGVDVNPRIGGWDPLAIQVIPGGSGL